MEMESAMDTEYELYSKQCIDMSEHGYDHDHVLFVEADYNSSLPPMEFRNMLVSNVSFSHYDIMDPTTALPRSCETLCDGMAKCECIEGIPRMNTMYYEMQMEQTFANADDEQTHVILFDDVIGNVDEIRFDLVDKEVKADDTVCVDCDASMNRLVKVEMSSELMAFGFIALLMFMCAKAIVMLIKQERINAKKNKKDKFMEKFNINAFANNPEIACTLMLNAKEE